MNFAVLEGRLSKLSARFSLVTCCAFGLLVSNIILSGFVWYSSLHQKTLVTPFFGDGAYIQSDFGVDVKYLSLLSENLIHERFNITPETVHGNHARILRFVDSSRYALIRNFLLREAANVVKHQLSSFFIITDLQIDAEKLTVKVTGFLERHVGIHPLQRIRQIHQLRFYHHLGRITLIGFHNIKEPS